MAPSRAPNTLARRGHPETSVEGARAAERTRARVYNAILEDLERRAQPATSREIGRAIGEDAWKRMRELETGNLVKECGTRKCRVTGKKAMTWALSRERKDSE